MQLASHVRSVLSFGGRSVAGDIAVVDPGLRGFHRDSGGSPTLDGVGLAELLAIHGSPLHVVQADKLARNADAALAPYLSGGRGADVFSSYKTNPLAGVLSRLHDRGIGAEAISAYELWLAFELGVPPERVVYNGPAKSYDSLQLAAERGVALVNANSVADLRNMLSAAASVGARMSAGLRVSMPHMWGGQFGIPSDSPALAQAVALGSTSHHLDLVGLHFHSGFALRDQVAVELHAHEVLALCDRLHAQTGWHPRIVDLGGSLVCPTVQPAERSFQFASIRRGRSTPPISIAMASSLFWKMFDQHFSAVGRPVPRLLLEPGRALTGDTQFLLTTAIDVRDDDMNSQRTVVIDAGAEIAEPVQSEHHDIINLSGDGRSIIAHRIVGPDACVSDQLADRVALPRVEVGDTLAIMDSGAYFIPFSTATARPRPAVVLVDGGHAVAIRRRESDEDLLALDGG